MVRKEFAWYRYGVGNTASAFFRSRIRGMSPGHVCVKGPVQLAMFIIYKLAVYMPWICDAV